jgi:hypothetical protein
MAEGIMVGFLSICILVLCRSNLKLKKQINSYEFEKFMREPLFEQRMEREIAMSVDSVRILQ